MTDTVPASKQNVFNGWKWLGSTSVHSCNCVGPQNGYPLCPCRMRNVQVKDGRYVETIDHGPARSTDGTPSSLFSKAIIAAEEGK